MVHLIIGNKAYSSWSLRPWIALRVCKIPFEETLIPLYEEGSPEKIRTFSPTGKVPCLIDGEIPVWESLSILEYLAEAFPEAHLLPSSPKDRALCRSVCAEMHAGFQGIRQFMSMNVRKFLPGKGWPKDPEARAKVEREVARIDGLWSDLCQAHGAQGPFLFGHFTMADAMFAPVVSRFKTYDIALSPAAQAYADSILALPEMVEWIADGVKEPWILPHCEM